MNWPLVPLSQVSALINGDRGKNYPSGNDIVESGIRFINAGHIVGNSLSKGKMNYITQDRFELLRGGKIQRNDILFCLRGSLGKCVLIQDNEAGSIASSLVIIRANPEQINPVFLQWILRSSQFQRQIGLHDNGTAQPNLSAKNLAKFEIPLPPLEEQKRIAAILDKADEIKKDTQESEELRDVFTHSLFIDIFGDPVINPMNWEEEKIENLCERIFAGGDVPKDSLSKEYTAEFTIPIYSNGKAEKSLYGFTSIPKVDKDSVTVSARGTIGFPVVRKAPFYPIIRLIVAIPNTEKVNLQYLCSAISYLEFGKGGSSIPQLTVPMLKSRTVLVPPIDLQEKFSRILESLREVPKSTELAENNSLSIAQQIFN